MEKSELLSILNEIEKEFYWNLKDAKKICFGKITLYLNSRNLKHPSESGILCSIESNYNKEINRRAICNISIEGNHPYEVTDKFINKIKENSLNKGFLELIDTLKNEFTNNEVEFIDEIIYDNDIALSYKNGIFFGIAIGNNTLKTKLTRDNQEKFFEEFHNRIKKILYEEYREPTQEELNKILEESEKVIEEVKI